MMNKNDSLSDILLKVKAGQLSIEEAKSQLSTFEDLGFAHLDIHREKRTGFPEVIFGQGKTTEQVIAIYQRLIPKNNIVLATRVAEEMGQEVTRLFPEVEYNRVARTLLYQANKEVTYNGYIAVVCAGTSDLPVAEEAAVTARAMGSNVKLICDVGVAGIHRLFDKIEQIRNANIIIVVAGMEGALPSVVGGLVSKPVIAVPTSIGYGTNLNGISALLSMLNSCANGITVVNIDNGYGAGYQAGVINRLINTKGE